MSVIWHDKAQKQLVDWIKTDRKTALRIYSLVFDIQRSGPMAGMGKPEPLRYCKSYSRRIDEKNRLVYSMNEQGVLEILACKGHYED